MPKSRLLAWLLCGLLLVAMVTGSALAQLSIVVSLSAPDTSAFPRISAYLDVHDAEGNFITGLQSTDVLLLEDGSEIPAAELQELRPGVQFVIAITSSDSFYIRDGLGITRYQYLLEGLLAGSWREQPSGQDDLSLLTSDGIEMIHTSDPADLYYTLAAYQPQGQTPNLEVLAQALEVAGDPTPRPGMERAILFITPPQIADVSVALQSLTARANQQNIRIFVWVLAAADYFGLPEAAQLRAPAEQTGGQFFGFSRNEPVPDLETYLEPLRSVYFLTYDSLVASPGTHQVAAQVAVSQAPVLSLEQTFELDLQPPSVALISPPSTILRQYPTAEPGATAEAAADLFPTEQTLTIEVGFPDGYSRSIVRTILYADEIIVAENSDPPFEEFAWDLRGYANDGTHILRVEAVDSLGLIGQSSEVTVQVTVPPPAQGVLVAFSRQRLLMAGIIILVAGSVLLLVLVLGGRIRPQVAGQSRKIKAKSGLASQQQRSDPVTQPVPIPAESTSKVQPRLPGWLNRFQRPPHKETPPVVAYLIPLVESGAASLPAPLSISADQASLGRDPLQSTLVVADPSVEALHTHLYRHDGAFWINDANTVAGTWVNYTLVPPQGTRLEHGDIVHIGRVAFRFTLREPGRLHKPVILPLERTP